MKKIQKNLLIIGIILVICIIIILVLLIMLQKTNSSPQSAKDPIDLNEVIEGEKVQKIMQAGNYLNLKYCTQIYYTAIANLKYSLAPGEIGPGYQVSGVNEHFRNVIYNLLSKPYKEANNITLNDVENMYQENGETKVFIDDAFKYKISESTSAYWVYGRLITSEISNFKLMIMMNTENLSFSVTPWEYVEKLGLDNINVGDVLDLEKVDYKLERNQYNAFSNKNGSNQELIEEYLNEFWSNLAVDKKSAYKRLNEEYAKAKFGSQAVFEEYLKNNIGKLSGSNLTEYNVSKEDEKTVYTCKDNKGRYYIINAKSILDYDIILDTYTIDIPEFVQRYNESTVQEKVILNLNKFMLALNDGDYKYAYSVLADSFKANYFKTQAEFENYVKANFFENNKFEYTKFGNDTNTYYTYDVTITDANVKEMSQKNKKFIMTLGSGTKFELSFNV